MSTHYHKIISILSLLESIYIFSNNEPRNGLYYLFIVPLAYGICVYSFGKWINKNIGLGLKIFFIISVMRYMVQPLFIILSNGELNNRMPQALPESYRIAIIIYVLEIFISFFTVNFYCKKWSKIKNKSFIPSNYTINVAGWCIIFIFLLLLLGRFNVWEPELKILGLKESRIDKGLVMDASFFNCLKGFFFVFLLSKSIFTKNRLYLLFAIIAALFNFLSYFGQNRSFIFETALATIALFSYAYPYYKKVVYTFFVPFAVLIVVYMYVTKQFGVDNISDYELGTQYDVIVSYSNIIEEYVNGLWTVARSYQAAINLPFEMSVSAFVKDVMDGLSPLRDVPFLKTEVFPLTDSLLSSSDIFKLSLKSHFGYAQMLSFSGGFFIVFGTFWGWPAMVLGNFLMVRLLVKIDVRSVFCSNLYYRYLYIWMSCLMGLIYCYCMQTIIFCLSKYVLFIWIILFANNLYRKINS